MTMLFFIALLKERWILSALVVSVGMLIHIQGEVFIPMMALYALLRVLPTSGALSDYPSKIKAIASSENIKRIALVSLGFLPLILAYSYLVLFKKWPLLAPNRSILNNLTASGSAYHGDPSLWYFSTGRTPLEQLWLIYSGFTSTFVSYYPDFLRVMPRAYQLGAILLVLVAFLFFRSLSLKAKTLCALPTLVVLLGHLALFEPWNVERWDFLPPFLIYFTAVGYPTKGDETKKTLKLALALAVIFSFAFTLSSFNAMTGIKESPLCAYADELPKLGDGHLPVLDTTNAQTWFGYYLRYRSDHRVIFVDKKTNVTEILLKNRQAYLSLVSYAEISKLPLPKANVSTVWMNPLNKYYSLVLWKLNSTSR